MKYFYRGTLNARVRNRIDEVERIFEPYRENIANKEG